jgi:hypothetical protein
MSRITRVIAIIFNPLPEDGLLGGLADELLGWLFGGLTGRSSCKT